MKAILFIFLINLGLLINAQRKKKHNQEVRYRPETITDQNAGGKVDGNTNNRNGDIDIVQQKTTLDSPLEESNTLEDSCPSCIGVDRKGAHLQTAIKHFWKKSFDLADDCLCHFVKSKQEDPVGKALSLSLDTAPNYFRKRSKGGITLSKSDFRSLVKTWDILGPINVGKLELDGDPTFVSFNMAESKLKGIAEYIMAMDDNSTIYTDLTIDAKISWKKYNSKSNGQIDLHYNLAWNEIAQGISSTSVYEWQGWARATTFIPTSGTYLIECLGPHTAYILNDFKTHTLTADVYRAQKLRTSIELKAGLVGIVIPLRAVVQAQFLFSIQPIPDHVVVYNPQQTPHLLELENKRGFGMLVSGIFLLPIHNVFSTSVTVTFALESPIDEQNIYHIREARRDESDHNNVMATSIAPGQTIAFPLELIRADESMLHDNKRKKKMSPTGDVAGDHDEKSEDRVSFLRCSENNRRVFQIIVSSSRGSSIQVPLELECRRWDQSFHVTYLTHDDSVGQAAVILPLDYHSPSHHRKLQMSSDLSSDYSSSNAQKQRRKIKKATEAANSPINPDQKQNLGEDFARANVDILDEYSGFPVLLTYHGSGIAAQNHADAYKVMPSHMKDYLFGVRGYYIVSPSRFGAHNWEGVGEYSGREALFAIAYMINHHFPDYLPHISIYHGIISGHSMGGHGAWVTATNMPDHFTCAAPTAGWIKKSEYSNSNDFFSLDIANTYTPVSLKRILEQALSEYHVDTLVPTLRTQDIHIRVGTHDMTTHSWYSRRMYRLLVEEQQRLRWGMGASTWNNVSLEEVAGKQHWWWDTIQDNDGGVLNDPKMRAFYSFCLQRSTENVIKIRRIQQVIFEEKHDNDKRTLLESNVHNEDSLAATANAEIDTSVDGTTRQTNTVFSTVTTSSSGKNEALLKENANIYNSRQSSASEAIVKLQEHVALLSSLPCHRNLSLMVINPATHTGLCGLQILQQTKMLEPSQVEVSCQYQIATPAPSKDDLSSSIHSRLSKTCTLRSANVHRLAIDWLATESPSAASVFTGHQIFADADTLIVKASSLRIGMGSESFRLDLKSLRQEKRQKRSLHICFAPYSSSATISMRNSNVNGAFSVAKLCDAQELHPLEEKQLVNYGPMRRVYDRLLYIVYGTPPNQLLRQAMRDLAVYIANAHYVAHNTFVPVISDLEFKTGQILRRRFMPNIIFIGDSTTNKLLKSVVSSLPSATSASSSIGVGMEELRGLLPGNLSFSYRESVMPAANAVDDDDEYVDPSRLSRSKQQQQQQQKDSYAFSLHNRVFDDANHGLAFTMPLHRVVSDSALAVPDTPRVSPRHRSLLHEHMYGREENREDEMKRHVAMGVVLHGNSVEAYRHLSRLAWPVIPPMVRAPFSLYLPDYVVIDETIWNRGPAGMLAAGYWDNQWRHDPQQSYWRVE